ncbi:MAG: hypothetical protein LQ339_008242 [Xanthoria mediterranea]|nr:MAG: hypothetical protein LQ339_008242 [Xanthoria mediterranea]
MAAPNLNGLEPILAALSTMQANVERSQKSQAHEYLEKFQKSPEAWTKTHSLLSSSNTIAEAKLFAATTLKGKITYDLDQLPRESLPSLRDSILALLVSFREGPRPVRTQLCVCLANLAIQLLEWKNVLDHVGSSLGSSAGDCILEFLKILPEEVTEGRKINLSEDELTVRTKELLEDNATQVLRLLNQYASSSAAAAVNPRLFECISSWLGEIPAADVVNSSLFDAIINGISNDASFDAAVDCMCMILRDTREVDEYMEVIQIIYPRVLSLRPRIAELAGSGDLDAYKGITRIFAEAGEAWVVMIARLPAEFRDLVESVLECCGRDQDRDAIALTFLFWYEMKQSITLDKYKQARIHYADIFGKLVDVMIKHLEYPTPDSADEADLFDGDREQEEKFREFRHQMGDVLKDCCEVITVTECLGKAFNRIQRWVSTYGSQTTSTSVPHWQELEAPLFSMRAMGGMVSPEESVVLRQAIPLIVQIPDHEKLQFQAIMALGRYTDWTAQHPEFLQPQLQFVIAGFNHSSKEVVRAAALAFKFFGTDCRKLLEGSVMELHTFYESVLDNLPPDSQEEITEGVACIISIQALDKVHSMFKTYCDPVIKRMMSCANQAKTAQDEGPRLAVAGYIQLLTVFVQNIQPYVSPQQENPAVKYCQEILPVLSTIAENFTSSTPILERVCRCWRYMVLSYRTAVLPLLPTLAQQLASGFENTRQGCFLWATDSVLREFAIGAEYVDASTSRAIYSFFEQQAFAFLRIMNDLPAEDLPDVIEDFFRLLIDALIYYHQQLLPSPVCQHILSAAISALTLQQDAPLIAALHFLRDLLSYGTEHPNSSNFDRQDSGQAPRNSPQLQQAVKQMIASQGEALVQRVMTGMMFSFPRDCIQDASGVLLSLFEILPLQSGVWVKETIGMLPAGSIRAGETDRLMNAVGMKIDAGDVRKVRVLLQDFTTSYRRRNVAPRDGLGRLEATRFRFNG